MMVLKFERSYRCWHMSPNGGATKAQEEVSGVRPDSGWEEPCHQVHWDFGQAASS